MARTSGRYGKFPQTASRSELVGLALLVLADARGDSAVLFALGFYPGGVVAVSGAAHADKFVWEGGRRGEIAKPQAAAN